MPDSTNGEANPYSKAKWKRVRKTVLERQEHQCLFCGVSDEAHRERYSNGLDVHHVIPRSDGGSDTPDNLAALCRSCHKTLESVHARAMDNVTSESTYSPEIAEMAHMCRFFEDWEDDLRGELQKFISNHPHFAQEAGLVGDDGRVNEGQYPVEQYDEVDQIKSEWGALVAYGFLQGISEFNSTINGVDAPFDDLVEVWLGHSDMSSVGAEGEE